MIVNFHFIQYLIFLLTHVSILHTNTPQQYVDNVPDSVQSRPSGITTKFVLEWFNMTVEFPNRNVPVIISS